MKLRIRGNSLRLRVTRPELEAFESSGAIHESLEFPAGPVLTYRLIADGQISEPKVDFAGDVISVRLPRVTVSKWLAPEEVGVHAELPLDGAEPLSLLVEKDFACLVTREGEDDSDAFPNPNAKT